MFSLLRRSNGGITHSKLFDDNTFYCAFINDLGACKEEVLIESPFITSRRMATLLPVLQRLRQRGVRVTINTRHPDEHDPHFSVQAIQALGGLHLIGANILYTGKHHRKIAILDGKILWEGSLNILSHNDSCEMMRRIESEHEAQEMIRFLGLGRFLG